MSTGMILVLMLIGLALIPVAAAGVNVPVESKCMQCSTDPTRWEDNPLAAALDCATQPQLE